MSQREALCLLNGDGFHQRLEVPVDRLLLGVDRLWKATQKHHRSGDVLASPSELWGIVPPSMMLRWTWRAQPRAPLIGLLARGVMWCAERAGTGGGWFYRLCHRSSPYSYAQARASVQGSKGVWV